MGSQPGLKTCFAAFACLILGCATESAPPAGPPLVAHWAFEDAAGGAVEDRSGHGHEGTLIGTAAVSEGFSGKALLIPGAGGIDVEDDSAFGLAGGFTLCLAMKLNAFPDGQAFAFFRGDGRAGLDPYLLAVDGTGKRLRFQITGDATGAGGGMMDTITAPIELGQWYRVNAVFDSAGGKTMALYLNGSLISEKPIGFIPMTKLDPSRNAAIGIGHHGGRTSGDYAFSGLIDEVKVYAGRLSREAIAKGKY